MTGYIEAFTKNVQNINVVNKDILFNVVKLDP